jgi:hypothetical protein
MLVSAYLGQGDTSRAEIIYDQMKTRGNTINTFATSHIGEMIRSVKSALKTAPRNVLSPSNEDTAASTTNAIPSDYSLIGNYPNPFNPATTIQYELPAVSRVVLNVYNVLGQLVKTLVDEIQDAGYKKIEWNASSFTSGIYFYRLEATSLSNSGKSFTQVKKMILIK